MDRARPQARAQPADGIGRLATMRTRAWSLRGIVLALGSIVSACGDRVTLPLLSTSAPVGRGDLLTPIAIVVPDTVRYGVPVEIGARFGDGTPPCGFRSVMGWTGGNHVTVMWTGSRMPTDVCTPPTMRWVPTTTWRTAEMPAHLGRQLIIACTAEGQTIAKLVVVRMLDANGDTIAVDVAPDDVVSAMELRWRTQGCAE